MGKKKVKVDWETFGLDPLIKPAVILLNAEGFRTVESCQGGEGHCVPEPIVWFEGTEFDIIRAYEICLAHGMCVIEGRRIYTKCTDIVKDDNWQNPLGQTYERPWNALVFRLHPDSGTIFYP